MKEDDYRSDLGGAISVDDFLNCSKDVGLPRDVFTCLVGVFKLSTEVVDCIFEPNLEEATYLLTLYLSLVSYDAIEFRGVTCLVLLPGKAEK